MPQAGDVIVMLVLERGPHMYRKLISITVLLLVLCLPAWAAADEVVRSAKAGLKYYQAGKLRKAMQEFQFAAAQLRQRWAQQLGRVLPPPPAGWRAPKSRPRAMGQAYLGGGTAASRSYYPPSGGGRVRIQLLGDSPLMRSMAMMMSNPMMMQQGGAQVVRVGGERARLHDQGRRVELMMLIDNQMLIMVTAQGLADNGAEARRFAGLVDLARLRKLLK